jgi:hypothetical protein
LGVSIWVGGCFFLKIFWGGGGGWEVGESIHLYHGSQASSARPSDKGSRKVEALKWLELAA